MTEAATPPTREWAIRTYLELERRAALRRDYAEATRLANERIRLFGISSGSSYSLPFTPREKSSVVEGRSRPTKLTDEQVREIRKSERTYSYLAMRYRVSVRTIHAVKKGESYAWVR